MCPAAGYFALRSSLHDTLLIYSALNRFIIVWAIFAKPCSWFVRAMLESGRFGALLVWKTRRLVLLNRLGESMTGMIVVPPVPATWTIRCMDDDHHHTVHPHRDMVVEAASHGLGDAWHDVREQRHDDRNPYICS